MFQRDPNLLFSNSFFLFGARGTGKTTLLRQRFSDRDPLVLDLLETDTELQLSRDPRRLYELCLERRPKWVVIDEVQKLPQLLEWVHKLIEEQGVRFALTGSSARKLKRGAANLLGGRAFVHTLFPLTFSELGAEFHLEDVLRFGSLPKRFDFETDRERVLYLRAYANTYLKEEIQAEQLVRNLSGFQRFLEVAAQYNGESLNYSKIADEASVDAKTVKRHFELLEDTLVGFRIPAYHRSLRKQQAKSPKFYLFDLGVKRALDRSVADPLRANTFAFGKSFEHLVIAECVRFNEYREKDYRLSYFRSKDGREIDLILEKAGEMHLIEIKSATEVIDRHLVSLKQLSAELPHAQSWVLCREAQPRNRDGIRIMPWRLGLKELFESEV